MVKLTESFLKKIAQIILKGEKDLADAKHLRIFFLDIIPIKLFS